MLVSSFSIYAKHVSKHVVNIHAMKTPKSVVAATFTFLHQWLTETIESP